MAMHTGGISGPVFVEHCVGVGSEVRLLTVPLRFEQRRDRQEVKYGVVLVIAAGGRSGFYDGLARSPMM